MVMTADLIGCWTLRSCRSVRENGEVSYPFGQNATGLLLYTPDNHMAVQIAAADRGSIGADNPPSPAAGAEQRANAFSTYLAYFGTYEVERDRVIHDVQTSLFPDWSRLVRPEASSRLHARWGHAHFDPRRGRHHD
jgi:hypothetical protein